MQARDLLEAWPGVGQLVDHGVTNRVEHNVCVVAQVRRLPRARILGHLRILQSHSGGDIRPLTAIVALQGEAEVAEGRKGQQEAKDSSDRFWDLSSALKSIEPIPTSLHRRSSSLPKALNKFRRPLILVLQHFGWRHWLSQRHIEGLIPIWGCKVLDWMGR